MVIFGWLRRITTLGEKREECRCGSIGPHVVARKTYWGHVFWVPVLLFWFRHGMMCTNCGEWTGLSYREVRQALKTGALPLARSRPQFAAVRPQLADDFGRLPTEPGFFDALTVNPKRGAFDLYLKVWLVAAAALVAWFVFAVVTAG